MKAFYFLIPILLVNACKTQNSSVVASENTTMEQVDNVAKDCPNNGDCQFEILKNKKLVIKQDDFGKSYPEIETGTGTIVQYTYSEKGPEGTVDGNYSETIHFEIPENMTSMDKADGDLQDIKLLWGKHCYCKGEAGYYPIEDGKISLKKSNNQLTVDLTFSTDKVSQRISTVSEVIKM